LTKITANNNKKIPIAEEVKSKFQLENNFPSSRDFQTVASPLSFTKPAGQMNSALYWKLLNSLGYEITLLPPECNSKS